MLKQLLITLFFLIVLLFIKNIDSYSLWYKEKIEKGYEEIEKIKDITDIETRRELRYGGQVKLYENIKKIISQQQKGNYKSLLLVPPLGYLQKTNSGLVLAEPAVVYYISGLSTVLPFTDMAKKANWALVVNNGLPNIIPINNQVQLDSLIELYKPYPFY